MKLDHIYHLVNPAGIISPSGLREIATIIKNGYGQPLPDIDHSWATKEGTMPKRIANHLFKKHGIKVTPTDMERIGNIGKMNSSNDRDIFFDFTRTINWTAGQFGDTSACLFSNRYKGVISLVSNDGMAMRLYTEKNPGGATFKKDTFYGIARAWVIDLSPQIGLAPESVFCVCNGYGRDSQTFARYFALFQGMNYGKKEFKVQDELSQEGFYFNGDSGFIVSNLPISSPEIKAIESIQFKKKKELSCPACHAPQKLENITAKNYTFCCPACNIECSACGTKGTGKLAKLRNGDTQYLVCEGCLPRIQLTYPNLHL